MPAPFIAALFALSAAVAWGSGDFVSGLSARRIGALYTLLLSFIVGLAGLLILTLLGAEPIPAFADLAWGVLAGMLGTGGFIFMLRGFTVGRMSIVAPVSAILAAAIPVVITAFSEGVPHQGQLLGFALAFASIWLLSSQGNEKSRPAGIGLALVAGLGFGLFFTMLDQISVGVIFWPLVASRLVAGLLLAGYFVVTRQPLVPSKPPWGLLVASGLLDVGGNFFFLQAVQTGRLDLSAVLVSLYPAVTVLLALLIAKERISRLQAAGVVAALIAILLITI
ncbi:MAG: DMT family transporter [Anaerolineales bacterium]